MSSETLNIREELKRLARPSERNLEIFEWIMGRKISQTETALEFNLSQPRVAQIVAQVRAWLIAATAEEAGELPPELALRYAGRVVRMRLENLLSLCMVGFEQSKQGTRLERSRMRESVHMLETVKQSSVGDLRWLTHYRQVALVLAKLDGVQTTPRIEPVGQPDAAAIARALAALAGQLDEQSVAAAEQQVERERAARAEERAAIRSPDEVALYDALQELGERPRDLSRDLAASVKTVKSSIPVAGLPTARPAAENGQKTPYKTVPASPPANPAASARRQEFLRSVPAAAPAA